MKRLSLCLTMMLLAVSFQLMTVSFVDAVTYDYVGNLFTEYCINNDGDCGAPSPDGWVTASVTFDADQNITAWWLSARGITLRSTDDGAFLAAGSFTFDDGEIVHWALSAANEDWQIETGNDGSDYFRDLITDYPAMPPDSDQPFWQTWVNYENPGTWTMEIPSSVPEPTSILLVCLGVVGLVAGKMKLKK